MEVLMDRQTKMEAIENEFTATAEPSNAAGVVAPEPVAENQVDSGTNENQAPLEEKEEKGQEKDWAQKRIDQITAKRRSAEEERDELRQELEALKQQVNEVKPAESKSQEPTLPQLRAELKKAMEEQDFEYATQIQEYMVDLKVNEREGKFIDQNKQADEAVIKQQQQWNALIDQYGKYGLSDTNSKLFKLAKAYYANDPGKNQALAVSNAFRDMVENGAIETEKTATIEQQLQAERRKQQLGSGVSGGGTVDQGALKSSDDHIKDFIKSRKQQYDTSRGISSPNK